MKTFRVVVVYGSDYAVEVEAEDEDSATQKVMDELESISIIEMDGAVNLGTGVGSQVIDCQEIKS